MVEVVNTNLSNVAFNYLKVLRISITKETLQTALEQNYYYPSLYSLSTVLTRFNISNQSFHLKEENLSYLMPPFITYLKGQPTGKDFVLITKINSTKVSYISNTNKETSVNKIEFLQDWERIVLIAEKSSDSGEQNYTENLKKEKRRKLKTLMLVTSCIVISILIVALTFFHLEFSEIKKNGSILAIKSLGAVISVFLLLYESHKNNSLIQNFCSSGKQVNCDAVLKSEKAMLFGLKWSEIGFFYFGASIIFLLFPGFESPDKAAWTNLTNLICIPYIPFSIYYQWRVIKQWCSFCLAIQFILVLQLAWCFYYFPEVFEWPTIDIPALSCFILSLLIPITIWAIIKPIVKTARLQTVYFAAYKRLLNDPEKFNNSLKKQPVAPDHSNLGITVGNQNASNTIVAVCNPYCEPCAKAHLALDELIESNHQINLKIIFNASNDENDRRKKPVAHLLAIHSKGNIRTTLHALNDWYLRKKDYTEFALKYPINEELYKQEEKIEAMNNWCKEAKIIYTPTIFVNQNKLPEDYNVKDLLAIL